MALDATTTQNYIRLALAQQQLYAFWNAAGDAARASLAMDVANWYYQQLGMPYYVPATNLSYTPNPIDPNTADAIAAALPLDAGTPSIPTASSVMLGAGTAGAASIQDLNRLSGMDSSLGGVAVPVAAAGFGTLSSGYDSGPGCGSDYCFYYPDDPICWNNWGNDFGNCGNGGGGDTTVINNTTININQQGLSLADVTSRISGALGQASAAIVTAVDTVLHLALSGVQSALNAIGNELISVYSLLSRLSGLILKFLQSLLLDVVHGLVSAVQWIGHMISDVFKNGLLPMLKALQELRTKLIALYERLLRPALIILQDMRRVLAILKVFHIGFATKLDNVLADIQSKITAPLLFLLQYTNAIANYINLILTAGYLLQRPLFLNSLNAYKGSAIALQVNAMNPPVDPAGLAALQAQNAVPTPAQSVASFDQFVTTGTGDFAAPIAEQTTLFEQYLSQGFVV